MTSDLTSTLEVRITHYVLYKSMHTLLTGAVTLLVVFSWFASTNCRSSSQSLPTEGRTQVACLTATILHRFFAVSVCRCIV